MTGRLDQFPVGGVHGEASRVISYTCAAVPHDFGVSDRRGFSLRGHGFDGGR